MNPQTGKYLMLAGVILVVAGVIVYFFPENLRWFGRLPGDIRIEKEKYRFYLPITTMVVISLFLSLLLALIRRFL